MIDSEELYQKDTFREFLIALQAFLEDVMMEGTSWKITLYLDALGTPQFYTDLERLVTRCEQHYGKDVTDFFVSNCIVDNNPNINKWGSLWCLMEDDIVEMKNFPTGNNMHRYRLKNNVGDDYAEMDNYKLSDCATFEDCRKKPKPSALASLQIIATLSGGQEIKLKAVGKNCDFLSYIFNRYIKPNTIKC